MNFVPPQSVRNDYKQTNYDYIPEDANDETLKQHEQKQQEYEGFQHQRQRSRNSKIIVVDKPIPLDNVTPSAPVDLDKQVRYQKLREARDKLLNQKREVKPTPVIVSPVKKPFKIKEDERDENTSESLFEPLSTKVFPSTKQREDRIRLLKKMIYKTEKESRIPSAIESSKLETQKAVHLAATKIEPLKEISLSPPESPTRNRRASINEHAPRIPSKLQTNVTRDDMSSWASSDSSSKDSAETEEAESTSLDAAIDSFQKLKLHQMENELSSEVEVKEEAEKENLRDYKDYDAMFEDLDNRVAKLNSKIDKLILELSILEQNKSIVKRGYWRALSIFLVSFVLLPAVSYFLAD